MSLESCINNALLDHIILLTFSDHQSLSLKDLNEHVSLEDSYQGLYSATKDFKFQNVTLRNNDYGIYAYSSSSISVAIYNSVIANGDIGVYINVISQTLGMLLVANSEIYDHSLEGIWIPRGMKNIELRSSILTNNLIAVYPQHNVRDFKVINVTLKNNSYGIYADYISGNILVDNCVITNGYNAIDLFQSTSQNISVRNSVIYGYDSVVYYYNYHHNYNHYNSQGIKLESCVLDRNDYVVSISSDNYRRRQISTAITLSRCILKENTRMMNLPSYYGHDVNLIVSECNISRTRYEGFYFSHSQVHRLTVKLSKNTFMANTRTILRIRATLGSNSSILINKNVFVNNSLPTGDALIDFAGKGMGAYFTNISENTFTENKCSFLLKVAAQSNRASGLFLFKNNILEDNEALHSNPLNYLAAGVYSFSIGLLGCVFNHYHIQYNVFDNELMQKEVFVGHICGSNYMHKKFDIDAKFNYWGSSTWNLRQRIFHFADWNDRPKVKYLPAFATRNFTDVMTTEIFVNNSQIGGYIDSPLRLTMTYSPYVVMTDLTIAENVTLKIEPGVKLYFKPNVGLLVFGNMVAEGTKSDQIKFCSLDSRCDHGHKQQMIRLVDGDRENEGILEILVGGMWQATCRNNFTSRVGEVACRQLGYGRYINHSRYFRYYGSSYKIYFNCNGNETTLFDCRSETRYCGYFNYGIYLQCEHNNRWGNIRIVLPKRRNSSEHNNVYEQSSLRNIFIHHAGYLHNQGVSSIQVIERSPSLTHIHIVESQGITVIGQSDIMALEDINVERNLGFPVLAILGNKGSVSVCRASIREGNHSGIAIAPIKNLTALMRPFLGQHDLCDPVQRIYIDGSSYVFLDRKSWNEDVFCSLEIISPNNTMIRIRLLFWVKNSYSIKIKYGDYYLTMYDSNYHQYEDRVIPSNSLLVEAEISTLRELLAELTVVNKTGKKFVH